MKYKVATFSLRGRENIWREDAKNVRDINDEDLTWSEFEWQLKKTYMSERYFDDRKK